MKKLVMLAFAVSALFALVSCFPKPRNVDAQKWREWLVEYEAFIDNEYIVKIEGTSDSNEAPNTMALMGVTMELVKFNQEGTTISSQLSNEELQAFITEFDRVGNKVLDLTNIEADEYDEGVLE